MIRAIQIGEKSKNVTEVVFGDGDIMMTRIRYDANLFSLALNEAPPMPIGSTTNEYAGRTVDDLPNEIKVVLSFKNPKSINALIYSLVEVQKDVFNDAIQPIT